MIQGFNGSRLHLRLCQASMDSSEMLKNYKELMKTRILLSGDICYIDTGKLEIVQEGTGELERMLKALIKSLEKKALYALYMSLFT